MESAYSALANWYDWVMVHVDYDEWASYVVQLMKKHSISTCNVLELAAGTGRFSELLPLDAHSLVVTDASLAMLQNIPMGLHNRLACDMRQLPFEKECFQTVFCFYDSFNYLLTNEDVQKTLQEVHRVLVPGGVFLFDVTTITNSMNWFEDVFDMDCTEDCDIVRHSWFDSSNSMQYNEFSFYIKQDSGLYKKETEQHKQKIWSLPQLQALLEQSLFMVQAVYGDFGFDAPSEHSERFQIVLRKP